MQVAMYTCGGASKAAGLTALLMLGSMLASGTSLYNEGGEAVKAVAQSEPDQHLTQWLCLKVMLAGSRHIHNQSHRRLCLQATWQSVAANADSVPEICLHIDDWPLMKIRNVRARSAFLDLPRNWHDDVYGNHKCCMAF